MAGILNEPADLAAQDGQNNHYLPNLVDDEGKKKKNALKSFGKKIGNKIGNKFKKNQNRGSVVSASSAGLTGVANQSFQQAEKAHAVDLLEFDQEPEQDEREKS